MSDIFREIDEEVRRDQLKKLWAEYGAYVIGVAVLIVILAAGRAGWQAWSKAHMQESSERYTAALELARNGDYEAVAAAFGAVAEDATSGYAVLARFEQTANLAFAGHLEEAVAQYDAIASDSSVPKLLRQVAIYKAALLVADTSTYDDLVGRLAGLTVPDGPFRHTANELLGLAAMKHGRIAEARAHFEQVITGTGVSMGVAQRAAAMLTQLRGISTTSGAASEVPQAGTGGPPSEEGAAGGTTRTGDEEQEAIDE